MSFEDYMVDTITLQDATGVDGAGEPTYSGSKYTALCRWEQVTRLVTGPTRNEVQADDAIATTTPITWTTRIWLPGADTTDVSAAKRPKAIKHAREMDGSGGHYEVYL
jgi:hypothetical protein